MLKEAAEKPLLGQRELENIRKKASHFRSELAKMKIAVICGGQTSEREVSLQSGRSVFSALSSEGFKAEIIDVETDRLKPETFRSFDIGFLTLHGGKGEDGTIQGFFDSIGFAYVSAGVTASAVGMNKPFLKMIVSSLGLKTPPYVHLTHKDAEVDEKAISQLNTEIFVIKPARQGSSVGVRIVPWERVLDSARESLETYGEIVIEKYISGKEITVSILGARQSPVVLPLVEIAPKREPFYDYKAKYTSGETDYIVPANIPSELARICAEQSATIYRIIDFSPYVRIDTRLSNDGELYFLEANTLPGFTPLSLFPKAASAVGISFSELIIILLYLSLRNRYG